MDSPAPPPEATLIRTARKAASLSIEAAAEQAGALSFVRWSQIENGYESRGGQRRPITGTDTHIAHMAYVVHVSPERLEQAGRPDAAVVLREIILQEHLAAEREPEPPRRRFANAGLQRMWDEHVGEVPEEDLLLMMRLGEALFIARQGKERRSA
jgi:hypothetical protein